MNDGIALKLVVSIRRMPGQEDLPLPDYQSEFAAGMDLHAAVPADQPLVLAPLGGGASGQVAKCPGGQVKEEGPSSVSNSATGPLGPSATPSTSPHIALVPCGFQLAVPPGFEAQIRPRSGLAVKHGISMPNTPGTIDSDYRGEVKVPLINFGSEPFVVTRGMRIAQLIIKPVPRVQWHEVTELPRTERGAGRIWAYGIDRRLAK